LGRRPVAGRPAGPLAVAKDRRSLVAESLAAWSLAAWSLTAHGDRA